MFNFLRKRDSSIEFNDCFDSKRDPKKSSSCIGAGYAATQTAQKMKSRVAQRFAKPDTYTGNRNLFDSASAKNNAKKNLFNNRNEVIDRYTGEKLVLTKREAKMLYGKDWAKHLAESDHVKPLERIFDDTKNNVWVSNDDIKMFANCDENIQVSSRIFNNPKRSRINKEYIEDEEYLKNKGVCLTSEGKRRAIKDSEIAEWAINKRIKKTSFLNMIETGREAGRAGAKSSGITATTMSGIMNMVAVIKGEKTADKAILDTAKDGGKAAVTGYIMSDGLTVVSHSLSSSSSHIIQGLAKSNVSGKVITAIMVTGETLIRWGNGEISTQECLIEIGDKGLNMATAGYAMAVGQALIPIPIVGAAIGALVGSTLTSTYYRDLINELQQKELDHKERERIILECNEVARQTIQFREELENYLNDYFGEYKNCFDTAIASMKFAYKSGDVDGVIAGANEITRKLGGKVMFNTVEEYKVFLDSKQDDVL